MSGSDTFTDAVVGGSAGGELSDAIQASRLNKRKRKSAFQSPTEPGICSNCETKLAGPVCHSCGQTADTFQRPIWELLMEVLDGLLGFEGRFWRTLPPLMFRPGRITQQYLSGVRARYVQPFRLYLTASVIFFLILFAVTNMGTPGLVNDEAGEGIATAAETVREEIDSSGLREQLEGSGLPDDQQAVILDGLNTVATGLEDAVDEDGELVLAHDDWKPDTILAIRHELVPEDYPELAEEAGTSEPGDESEPGVVALDDGVSMNFDGVEQIPLDARRFLADQLETIINDNGESMIEAMQEWTPRLMFFMLPIYAFLLALTHFYKRGYYFYDHLVVSLHFHAFIFFLFIGLIGFGAFVSPALAIPIFLVWSNLYLYKVHRIVYKHGRFSSIVRTLFMDFVYSILLSIVSLLLVVIGVFNA
jgi:hypothetical protein